MSRFLRVLVPLSLLAATVTATPATAAAVAARPAPEFTVTTTASTVASRTDRRPMAGTVHDPVAGATYITWSGRHADNYVQAFDPHSVADGWTQTEVTQGKAASYPMPFKTANGDIPVFFRETTQELDPSVPTDTRPMRYDRYHRNICYAWFDPATRTFHSAGGRDLGTQIDDADQEQHLKVAETPLVLPGGMKSPDYIQFVGVNGNRPFLLWFTGDDNKVLHDFASVWTGNRWETSEIATGASSDRDVKVADGDITVAGIRACRIQLPVLGCVLR